MKLTRVLVADDHPLIAEGLKQVLGPSYEICGIVADGNLLWEFSQHFQPDIIAMELFLRHESGLQVMRRILHRGHPTKFAILTMNTDPDEAARAIAAGISAVILKHSPPNELIRAFKIVSDGQRYLAPDLTPNMEASPKTQAENSDFIPHLTTRQLEVLKLFGEGYSAKEVASRLFISPRTAENHKATLKKILQVNSTAGLVRQAIRLGLINPQ